MANIVFRPNDYEYDWVTGRVKLVSEGTLIWDSGDLDWNIDQYNKEHTLEIPNDEFKSADTLKIGLWDADYEPNSPYRIYLDDNIIAVFPVGPNKQWQWKSVETGAMKIGFPWKGTLIGSGVGTAIGYGATKGPKTVIGTGLGALVGYLVEKFGIRR